MFKTKNIITVVLVLSMLLIVGCSNDSENNTSDVIEGTTPEKTILIQPLKIGLMPAVDSAPMFLAEKEGYFTALGLNVEFIVFNNGQDRQTALQTGAIDGAMTDFIAVATNVNAGFDIKATTMTSGMFPILVKQGFEEKKEITVGMMEVSVSNFLVDEWLSEDYNIKKTFINEIPARLEMIKTGNLDMGLFPEPLASMGVLAGLERRVFTPEDGYNPDVMVFTGTALKEKSASIQLFHKGYNQAVDAINENTELAINILIEKLNLKEEIRSLILLPDYQKANLPSEAYLVKIITWTENVIGKPMTVTPEDLVEGKYVN